MGAEIWKRTRLVRDDASGPFDARDLVLMIVVRSSNAPQQLRRLRLRTVIRLAFGIDPYNQLYAVKAGDEEWSGRG